MVLQHKQAVEFSKQQLAKSGQGSFVASKEDQESFFSTPSPDKKNRAKENESVEKEGEKKVSIGDGLKLALEDEDDKKSEEKNELDQLEQDGQENRNELEEFEDMQRQNSGDVQRQNSSDN